MIAAAFFAVQHVGGLDVMVERLSAPMLAPDGQTMLHYLNVLPDFTSNRDILVAVFIMPLAVQWWATWYPGAEPGGGSYIAQRMLASRFRPHALLGTERRRVELGTDLEAADIPYYRASAEVMAAAKGEGNAVKRKEDTHKMAEANRAFAHFK